MRIAYVTAHLPPDFTSGATLLVDRLAREAARQGHEVEVFAGAIEQGLADGEIRVDPADDQPVTVRWIGTAERIDQDIDANWDNPLAAAAAAEWLRAFRPDVIHVHAVQTLGVGVIEAATEGARATGARTVVTMHDLWWWCARLFLVDTELQPCPLVTDIDTCACARSARWRHDRAVRLRRALGDVDRILAPSSALRDVILANGVAPDRVSVDENHVADSVVDAVVDAAAGARAGSAGRASVSPAPDGQPKAPEHLLYIGGDSTLKGADVLRDAARQLAHDADVAGSDWQLDAYGLAPADDAPPNLRHLTPFDAADVMDVMADHDVLILPSLARESFSIAAREALAAGLAVITSDCLGPEEVVLDGVNGLVVPTGDTAALAGAVRSVIADRTLLAGLRDGAAAQPVMLRTAAQHLSALLAVYSAPPSRKPGTGPVVGFVVGVDGAPARRRVHRPSTALALAGVSEPGPVVHHLDPRLVESMVGCDVVLVQQFPPTDAVRAAIDSWRASGMRIVFDIAEPPVRPMADTVAATDDSAWQSLPACDGVVAATTAIAERLAAAIDVHPFAIPDSAGLIELQLAQLARAEPRDRRDVGVVRIGYVSDTPDAQADLDALAPALADVLDRHHHTELAVVGPLELGPDLTRFGDRVQRFESPPWRETPTLLLGIDVNVSPAPKATALTGATTGADTTVQSWLDAAMMEVPTVAASEGASAELIDGGRSGLLGTSVAERAAAIDVLVTDPVRRARMGAAARREVELHHGPHVTAHRYRDVFDSLDLPRRSGALAEPTTDSRADSVHPLASYDLGGAVVGDAVVVGAGGATGVDSRSLGRRLLGRARRAGVVGVGRVRRR